LKYAEGQRVEVRGTWRRRGDEEERFYECLYQGRWVILPDEKKE
jgi:hypothetical protein